MDCRPTICEETSFGSAVTAGPPRGCQFSINEYASLIASVSFTAASIAGTLFCFVGHKPEPSTRSTPELEGGDGLGPYRTNWAAVRIV
jgi:hypothetical protein